MSIDPIRFNLSQTKSAGSKPAAPAAPVVGPQLKMSQDAWQGASARDDEQERYRLDPDLEEKFGKGEGKKLKLGVGADLDESTRLELNASLKKGGSVKIELHHKF